MIIPIHVEGLNEGLNQNEGLNEEISEGLNQNEGLNEEINEGLKSLWVIIQNNPGIQSKDISVLLENRPIKTIERQIKTLTEMNLIERIGSKKLGGYHPIKK